MLAVEANLANTYSALERNEEALSLRQDVYSRHLKVNGREHGGTLLAASNYASSLIELKRFQQAKSLLRKSIPAARRVLGDSDEVTLHLRWNYAQSLGCDAAATLDNLREVVATLEETERIARRVFGGANPLPAGIESSLRNARDVLAARDGSSVRAIGEAVAAMATSDA